MRCPSLLLLAICACVRTSHATTNTTSGKWFDKVVIVIFENHSEKEVLKVRSITGDAIGFSPSEIPKCATHPIGQTFPQVHKLGKRV